MPYKIKVIRWTYDYDKLRKTSSPYTEYKLYWYHEGLCEYPYIFDNERVVISAHRGIRFKYCNFFYNIRQFKKFCEEKYGLKDIPVETIRQRHYFAAQRM